jgi:hypothetical protein
MDPSVLAFGPALVGAIATDTWPRVREAVTGLWRRVHPQKADDIGTELDELREQVLPARRDGDADTAPRRPLPAVKVRRDLQRHLPLLLRLS